ncbi:Gluconate 5-dehydrogenase [Xylophilus ampelinus]|nr:Gluconate 5-dehydrogenase [Xylophilus ampelinus]
MRTPSFRLDGKKAFVAGGSQGIGFAAASALAEAGATVTLAARSEGSLREACATITEAGGRCDYLVLDVTDSKAVEDVFRRRADYSVVVASAGMNRPKPLAEVTDEDVHDILDLNVKSCFYLARAAVKAMVGASIPGSIILVSSQMGQVGSPTRTLYCASKHAVEGLTKSLAWEVGAHGIRVNTLCPTFIETPMTEPMFSRPGFREWVVERIALRRVGRMEEVMGAIAFLASDASSLMTGSALSLDGGWSAA